MVLSTLRSPEQDGASIRIPLTTLTPLFTGGIGQYGEQVHPSGLLGSIRYFSCLVAAAVGDREFINQVWGSTGDQHAHAKQVAFRWEVEGLQKVNLPSSITLKRDDGKNSKWFFTCAQQGNLVLVLTKRGITDTHWNLLLIALRIQIRWASFGAKDQFGLGVLGCEQLPIVQALKPIQSAINQCPGLQRSFFTRISFTVSAPLNSEQCLKAGLQWRQFLRGQFRKSDECMDEKKLRHYLFGNIKGRDRYGSAINISAAYLVDNNSYELRIWGAIPHTTIFPFNRQYTAIMECLTKAIDNAPPEFKGISKRLVEFSPNTEAMIPWINQLAGVNHD